MPSVQYGGVPKTILQEVPSGTNRYKQWLEEMCVTWVSNKSWLRLLWGRDVLSPQTDHPICSTLQLAHLTKLSNRSMFLRSLTNSPIIFLSSRGFSRSHWATSVLSMGMVRRPFSCKNWIPFFGFWLNCSVPVISSWRENETKQKLDVSQAALDLHQAMAGWSALQLPAGHLIDCWDGFLVTPGPSPESGWP